MKKVAKPITTWRPAKLGDAITHAPAFFEIDDAIEYQLVTVKLHGKGIVERSKLRGAQIKTKEQQRIKAGQLLVAEIDAKFGAFGVVPDALDGAIVSGHYFLYDVNEDVLLKRFLRCFIASGLLTKAIQKDIQGALNYSAIRPHHVLAVPISMPPTLDEQAKIATRFETIERIQRAAALQFEASNALARSTMLEIFGSVEESE